MKPAYLSAKLTDPPWCMAENTQPDGNEQSKQASPANLKRSAAQFLLFFRSRLNLDDDKADPEETSTYIRKGVEFKGTNVWILIFAIFIASVGLNVNSTAVIIGAMLISPLMGPIMGIGLGAGINDFDLIKKSAINLGVMVGISVATSTLYFLLSPLSDAQSELLSRTQPTIWDVLIALFGGLAGIVAGSRKEKSNAIPGVAIATALMPPLCTAGYGLATQQWSYFFGAFYLFTINSVFISFSTLMIVRFLKYPKKDFMDPIRERRVKRIIAAFVIVTTLPSLYIAFNLVRDSVFEREAGVFVNQNFNFDYAQVISKKVTRVGEQRTIEVALIGEPVTPQVIEQIRGQMKVNEQLADAQLIVRQGAIKEDGLDMETVQMMNQSLKTGIIEDLYKRNEEALQSKDEKIKTLEEEVYQLRSRELPVAQISKELHAQHENLTEFTLMRNPICTIDSMRLDTVIFAFCEFKRKPRKDELKRLESFLKVRTDADSLKLVVQ